MNSSEHTKIAQKTCPQCNKSMGIARKACSGCTHIFRKPVCVRANGSISDSFGMTSSRLRIKAYEAVREKTIIPLVPRKRQLSMERMRLSEEMASSENAKLPVNEYAKDEEKENTCSVPSEEEPAPVVMTSQDIATIVEEELDTGVVPSATELLDVTEMSGNVVNSQEVSGVSEMSVKKEKCGMEHLSNSVMDVPTTVSQCSSSQFSSTDPVPPEQLHSVNSITAMSSDYLANGVAQTPKRSMKVPGYVPRKRGRPKGSTTKNRRVRVPGGLNLWAPKSMNQAKLSTLEMMALAAQHTQNTNEQSQSQLMAALLWQQQHQQQKQHAQSYSNEALQLAMACDGNLHQMFLDEQQSILSQQQALLGTNSSSVVSNDIHTNSLLEIQLKQEIENLERVLLGQDHNQTPAPMGLDSGLYQLNKLVSQNNVSSSPVKNVIQNTMNDIVQNTVNNVVQNAISANTSPQMMNGSLNNSKLYQDVMDINKNAPKMSNQDLLLRDAMMKMQAQSLQGSPNNAGPKISKPNQLPPHGLSSSGHMIGITAPGKQWSEPAFPRSLPSIQSVQSVPSQSIAAPKSVSTSGRETNEEVARQFLEVIKSLGPDNTETAQMIQLLIEQSSDPVQQSTSSPIQSSRTPNSTLAAVKVSQASLASPQSSLNVPQTPFSIPQQTRNVPQPLISSSSFSIPQQTLSISQPLTSTSLFSNSTNSLKFSPSTTSKPKSMINVLPPSLSIPKPSINIPSSSLKINQPPLSIPQPLLNISQNIQNYPKNAGFTSGAMPTQIKTIRESPQYTSLIPDVRQDQTPKMSDLEQLISCLKSPSQQRIEKAVFSPKIENVSNLDSRLPKARGRSPGTPNGTGANIFKSIDGKKHRGRPRKYPEQYYNMVNGKMKYPGAKERRMFFPATEGKFGSPSGVLSQLHHPSGNYDSPVPTSAAHKPVLANQEISVKTEIQTADVSSSSQTSDSRHSVSMLETPPSAPAKKRGRPKGSKNKPFLITSPQQLLDLRPPYPESSMVWSGMPDYKQAQIAAVLSGINHKLFRQSTSFTV